MGDKEESVFKNLKKMGDIIYGWPLTYLPIPHNANTQKICFKSRQSLRKTNHFYSLEMIYEWTHQKISVKL